MGAQSLTTHADISAVLDQVVQETFELLFFTEAVLQPEEELKKLSDVDGLEVSLEIKARFTGKIIMQLSRESGFWLAGSMPGMAAPTGETVTDLFAEVINTIGGRIAAALAQAGVSFDLSIPEVKFGKISEEQASSVRCYRVEHSLIGVFVILNS